MKPEEMPIVEATGRVRFSSRQKLIKHVVKHVIANRDERWHQVLGDELVADARVEYRNGQRGAAFKALERRYQKFVSDRLLELCRQGRSHWHSCRYTTDFFDMSRKAVAQIIDGWPEDEKLILMASAHVKGGRVAPYRLKTAFRPWPRLAVSGHRRKARERARNLQSIYPRCVLQVHDQ